MEFSQGLGPQPLWAFGIFSNLSDEAVFWRLIMGRLAWFLLMLSIVTVLSAVPASAQVEKATVKISGMI